MKKHLSNIILVAVFLVGLSVLLYPSVSDWWNSTRQSRAIINYEELVATYSNEDYERELRRAEEYNHKLLEMEYPLVAYKEIESNEDILNLDGSGIMGYLSIPKIDVQLPIYHGTESQVLMNAVGNFEGTSLPVGGLGTHAVISGHRGLPSARLLSDLDQLAVGDVFYIQVLNRRLMYQVDQIRIVLPEETEELAIDPLQDYVTLLTCTPYGINSHRLLVRGTRIYDDSKMISIQSEAYKLDSLLLAPVVAAPILLVLLIYLLVKYRKKKA